MSKLTNKIIPLTKSEIKFVEAELSNNETDTDNDLVEYFMDVLEISREDAVSVVSHRDYYLNNLK